MRTLIPVFFVLSLGASATALAAPVTYEVDAKHTHPHFEADHFGGVSVWRGGFNASGGSIVLDRDAQSGTVDVTIDTTTVLTGVPDLDKHLKSADFLDVEKFPTITFKSKKIEAGAAGHTKVTGDLTLHGMTKEVVLDVEGPTPVIKDPMGNTKAGAHATTKINRKDFGIVWNKSLDGGGLMVGDDIDVTIDIEAVKKGD